VKVPDDIAAQLGETPPPEAPEDPDTHHCHARGCRTPCEPERLMCLAHWRMVPRDLQREVWRHYRHGQCDDMRPSEAWHKAADAAIRAVFDKESARRRPDTGSLL
jgi:hypothetical protein